MKKAIVWGANGGIGRAIQDKLDIEGWITVGAARHNVQDIKNDLQIRADFCELETVQRELQRVSEQSNPFDLWIYAAGDILSNKAESLDLQHWNRIMNNNLNAAFITYQASLPYLAPDAHLFFLGAISERLRLPGLSAYATAKAGLEAFVMTIAKEDRKRKYTVIRPAAVATSFWEKVPFNLPSYSATPEKVAMKILEAYENSEKGLLDLV
jgi:NAD(P)-dependent dehydrogenase (short-subunit alcohol dehydrogenase family)